MVGIFSALGDLFAGGGGTPEFPKPTPEEQQLQRAQIDLLNQQRGAVTSQLAQQELLAPILWQQAGIRPVYRIYSNVTGATYATQEEALAAGESPQSLAQDRLPASFEQFETPQMAAQRSALENYNRILGAQAEALPGQLALQKQQASFAQMLQPLALEQAGYNVQRDAQGNIVGITINPQSAPAMQEQVNRQLLTRTQQALEGKLPVDPFLERQFAQHEQILRAGLRNQLGPGYETSTPGIQALADFQQRKQETIFAAQHGEIGSAAQLAMAGEASSRGNLATGQQTGFAGAQALGQPSPYGMPPPIPNYSGQTAQGMQWALQAPYQGASGLGTLAELYSRPIGYNVQNRAYEYGGLVESDLTTPSNILARESARNAGQWAGPSAYSGMMGGGSRGGGSLS